MLKFILERVSFVIGVLLAGCFVPLVGVKVLYAAFQGVTTITGDLSLSSVSLELANLVFDLGEFSQDELFDLFINI